MKFIEKVQSNDEFGIYFFYKVIHRGFMMLVVDNIKITIKNKKESSKIKFYSLLVIIKIFN